MFWTTKPINRTTARNGLLINALVAPGAGTIFTGKVALGLAQLALALSGFFFVLAWFIGIMGQYYGQIVDGTEIKPIGWIGLAGAIQFAGAWLWALITSWQAWRRAPPEAASTDKPPVMGKQF